MTLYTITKSSPILVSPTNSTPIETLPLSSIDRTGPAGVYVEFISVYSHGDNPAIKIKDAFAKALVHYYPVAGRISKKCFGEPVVDCTGEGIWFVEAKVNCNLEDITFLEKPFTILKEEMMLKLPASVKLEEQILMAQITEFTCGGFTVGICFNHLLFDGQGAAQFLKAVGEMSQGLTEPTVKPIWSRESIPTPPKVPSSAPLLSFTALNLVTSVVEVSHEAINNTKEKFMSETGKPCTTFEVITASVFKSRTKAIKLAIDAEARLAIAASTRHLLHDVLPSVEGYYGNCLYPLMITKTSEEINNAPLSEVIALIKDAKESLSEKFVNWMNDGLYCNIPIDYGTIIVSDWRWAGFNEVDYGWGKPKSIVQVRDDVNLVVGLGTYLRTPLPNQGIILKLACAKQEHVVEFLNELHKLLELNVFLPTCNL